MQQLIGLMWHGLRRWLPIAAVTCVVGMSDLARAQQTEIVIDDKRAFPESVTSTHDGTIFMGSFVHGTVYRALPGATKAAPWIEARPTDLKRVVGVFAHEPSNTLGLFR